MRWLSDKGSSKPIITVFMSLWEQEPLFQFGRRYRQTEIKENIHIRIYFYDREEVWNADISLTGSFMLWKIVVYCIVFACCGTQLDEMLKMECIITPNVFHFSPLNPFGWLTVCGDPHPAANQLLHIGRINEAVSHWWRTKWGFVWVVSGFTENSGRQRY